MVDIMSVDCLNPDIDRYVVWTKCNKHLWHIREIIIDKCLQIYFLQTGSKELLFTFLKQVI